MAKDNMLRLRRGIDFDNPQKRPLFPLWGMDKISYWSPVNKHRRCERPQAEFTPVCVLSSLRDFWASSLKLLIARKTE